MKIEFIVIITITKSCRWIYRKFFEKINTFTIVDRFKDILDLNFNSKIKNSEYYRNYILMKIYLSHPNRKVRDLGYELYVSQIGLERINVSELNQILGLESGDMDILDFN